MKRFALLVLTALFGLVSCEYDDTALKESLKDHEDRLNRLEETCKEMNGNISALQAIVKVLEEGDFITSVVPHKDDGQEVGYEISFSRQDPVIIYHGKNGLDGKNPVIGMKKDQDGHYYWMLDGEWMLSDAGGKVRADAEDGLSPEMKIEGGHWLVRYGDGTWKDLGPAESGSSLFEEVKVVEDTLVFTLSGGETIRVPVVSEGRFGITFDRNDLVVSDGERLSVHYTVQGADSVQVKALGQNGWTAVVTPSSVTSGVISIYAPDPVVSTEIVVLVNDGAYRSVMSSIRMTAASCRPAREEVRISETSWQFDINVDSNVDYEVVVAEGDRNWISVQAGIPANRPDRLTFSIAENSGLPRDTRVLLQYRGGQCSIHILQGGHIAPVPSSSQLYYTTLDALPLELGREFDEAMGLDVISNHYYPVEGIGIIDFSGTVTAIGDLAFRNCTRMTHITLPSSVTAIGNRSFFGCSGFSEIDIPEGVTTLGEGAYDSCTGATVITIPSTVTFIGNGAFYYCDQLEKVYCKPLQVPETYATLFLQGTPIYVPNTSIDAYKRAEYWRYNSRDMIGSDFAR